MSLSMQRKWFTGRLERILDSDEKVNFVLLLEDHPGEITNTLVEKCAAFGAKKCLLALLNGELCDPPPTLDAHGGDTALAYAAHCCPDPQIIDLMLKRCNAVPLVNSSCTISSVHGLPIHFVLLHLSYLEHLYFWGRGDSLIKLIILLCSWNTKPILDSVRFLAQYTDSINHIAWILVKHGALKQFVALLLVARDQVMVPFYTGLTIYQWLTIEIKSLSVDDIGSELVDYKNILIDAQNFLEVFERAGDALSLYCSSMQKYVAVERTIDDVCKVLKKYKVYVDLNDINVYRIFRKKHGILKIDTKKLTGPHFVEFQDFLHVTPTEKFNAQYAHGHFPTIKPLWESGLYRPRRILSNGAIYAMNASKPAPFNQSLEQLAHMTMKLKKGLKFL